MRITLENFKDHVTPYELRKGQDYFDKGRVSQLKQSPTGRWTAVVEGREPYDVQFDTDGSEISEVRCGCIAQAEKTFCKHVLAVLLAIEQQAQTGSAMTMGYETETGILHRNVTKAIKKDKDYRTAANTILTLLKGMPDPGELGTGIHIDELILERVQLGFRLMVKLAGLPSVPQELKDRMYRRSADTALDTRWPFTRFDPHWIDVLMVLSKGKEEDALAIVDSLLKSLAYPLDDQALSRLLAMKMVLLRTLGAALSGLLVEYPLSKWLWDTMINEAVKKKDYPQVKLLIEQGLREARPEDSSLYHHLQDMAFHLAEQFNDVETLRYYARLYYGRNKDIHYYRLLKATYATWEWQTVLETEFVQPLEKMMSDPEVQPDQLASIYAEELDWPRLLRLLERKPRLDWLHEYAAVLAPHFPAELLGLFRKALLDFAADPTSRYADANDAMFGTVRLMRGWPGGPAAVNALIDEFHRVFPTRYKLLEALAELRK